ncbi:MAG: transcription termination/antitermination protein NusA [Candidatus Eremiobacteraeota bacterium]|nr:transcription termination/antitermination protein NusA [Candidatus Eremiobacteraeota bacterium]
MNTEMLSALKEIETERGIGFEMLLEALEAALISAYKRNYGGDANAIVTIDRQSGEYKVYHRRNVVEEVADAKLEISKREAGGRYEPGDFYDEEVTPKDFGRIAAQTAKQVIVQRIREAERDTIFNTYSAKLHDIVMGVVQRYEQRNMYVLLDAKHEALLALSEQVHRENYRINDRIRAYVLDVRKSPKGPLVVLSRAAEGLVQRLLENQVPEIRDDIVEIMAIAREPGSRTKVAVHSQRPEIDAVGACLGPKSSRIANVSDELRGEKIDVIRWAPDANSFIQNALAPAKVIGVELFEDDGVALVTVPDYQLSLAIGREGQNVRLAARLTGWRLDITGESEAEENRGRYFAERAEREGVAPVVEAEAAAEGAEPVPVAEGETVDAELLRRLEEIKKEMFEQ